ncbi:MAG: TniQ family protein, partial [Flammeovirgaceae bacterium]|nr:TniQ family protein [Flammeovirgaceae bacterium]
MSYYLLLKPGETIISYRGRYREHLLISNHKANEQLFGSVLHPLDNDFPRLTKHFISKMKELGVSRSMIINDHTSFPFYKNFFTNERTESIRDFINDKNRFVGALLSFSNGIRYCPLCVKSDLENDHETYWRREHNLSSIQTCTIHDCFLNSVKASVINKTKLSPNQIDFYNLTAIFNNNKLLSQFDKGLVEILHGRITFQREELVRAALKKGFIERKPSNKYFMNKTELEEFRKYALAVTGKNDFTKQQFLNKVFNNNWNGYCPELYILLQDFLKPRPNIKTESSFKADFKCINQSCSDFNKLGENTSVTNSLYRKGLVYVSCSTCGMCYRINLLIKPIAPKLVFAGSLVQVELKRLSQSGMTMEAASQRLGISRIHLK